MIDYRAKRLFVVLIGVLLFAVAAQVAFAEDYYWRWTTPLPEVLCDSGGRPPTEIQYLGISDDLFYEYNLPAGATLDEYIIENSVSSYQGNFPAPVGMGSDSITGGFDSSIVASYYTYVLRRDTIIDGQVVYMSSLYLNCPDMTASIVNQAFGGVCAAPLPEDSVVGALPNDTQAFYAPGKAAPGVIINAGTYWVLGQDESGEYYKILLSCQYLWVPIDSMQPNYDDVWMGTPLPTNVVS